MISALHLRFLVVLIPLLKWPTGSAQQCTDTIPEDVLLLANFVPADASTKYPESKVSEAISKLPQEVQASIRASQTDTVDTLSDVFGQDGYFQDACSTYRYVLPFKWWFFNYMRMKCFSLQPIYITWCKTRYCSLSDKSKSYWWYRCVPEWRNQYFWSVCTDQSGVTTARYVKWKVPGSCSCKHYKNYGSDVCQDKTEPETEFPSRPWEDIH